MYSSILNNYSAQDKELFFHVFDKENSSFVKLSNWTNLVETNFINYNFFFYNFGTLNFIESPFSFFNTFQFFKNMENNLFFIFNIKEKVLSYENDFIIDTDITELYINLRKSTFITFFTTNMIDIPICFKKSKSLKNKNFEFLFLKFTNLVMREGKKEKTFRTILNNFFYFFNEKFENEALSTDFSISWFELFFFFNNNIKLSQKNTWSSIETIEESHLIYNHLLSKNYKEFDTNFFIKNFFFSKLIQLSPLFNYFIYSVDKNVRKYTRGKSGKYIFIWKYIAPYKRHYLMCRWFLKELKFDESRSINKRFYNLYHLLTYDIKQTYAWKAKNYTYAFIFKNFRKTLMTHLKTITS